MNPNTEPSGVQSTQCIRRATYLQESSLAGQLCVSRAMADRSDNVVRGKNVREKGRKHTSGS